MRVEYRWNKSRRFPAARELRDDLTAKNPFGVAAVKIARQDR